MVVFKLNKNSSIGVFDSGLGGLSVLATLQKLLPNESYIYVGDSKNAPYGTKSKEEVLELSRQICNQLVSLDVKAIVIACNTATSAAVNQLREEYDIPIIGMEPAVKPALRQSKGKVAVLATEMTLKEEKFQKLIESLEDG
jgi:glutamate racemase